MLNPLNKIMKERQDLVALAAHDSYRDYYTSLHNKDQNPCSKMRDSIKESVRRNMLKKDYPEPLILEYEVSIANDLISMCKKDIMHVQRTAAAVNNTLKGRWTQTVGGAAGHKRYVKSFSAKQRKASRSSSGTQRNAASRKIQPSLTYLKTRSSKIRRVSNQASSSDKPGHR